MQALTDSQSNLLGLSGGGPPTTQTQQIGLDWNGFNQRLLISLFTITVCT